MGMFVSGLLIFFGLHWVTTTAATRRAAVNVTGPNAWKGIMALGSLAGVALIVMGWKGAPNTSLFAPSPLAIRFAPALVTIALILFVIGGGNLKGHIRRNLHHPMLIGVFIWAFTHLLANGGWRETVLFGAFAAFSAYALVALLLAGKRTSFVPSAKWDAIGIAIGLVVAIGVMHGHKWLFGVAVS